MGWDSVDRFVHLVGDVISDLLLRARGVPSSFSVIDDNRSGVDEVFV